MAFSPVPRVFSTLHTRLRPRETLIHYNVIYKKIYTKSRTLHALCEHHGSPSSGEGQEPPGTHGAWRRPGVSPRVGTHRDGHRPGVDTHCPGWGRLTWAPTVRVFKASAFRHRGVTVELYRNACSVIFGPCDEFPDLEHDACRLAFVAPHGANERRGSEGPSPVGCPRADVPG
eukprot:scaffold90012_cov30-Phaeocystis_antarctica.AAC.1